MARFLFLLAFLLSLPPHSQYILPSLNKPSSRTAKPVPETVDILEPSSRPLVRPISSSKTAATLHILPRLVNPPPSNHDLNATLLRRKFPLPLRVPRTVYYDHLIKYHSRRFIHNVSSKVKGFRRGIPCRIKRFKAVLTGKLSPHCNAVKAVGQTKPGIRIRLVHAPPRPPPPTGTTYVYTPPTRVPHIPPTGSVQTHITTMELIFGLFLLVVPITLVKGRFSAGLERNDTTALATSQRNKGIRVTPALRRFIFSKRNDVVSYKRGRYAPRAVKTPRVFVYSLRAAVKQFSRITPAESTSGVFSEPSVDPYVSFSLKNDIEFHAYTPFPDLSPSKLPEHYRECHAYISSSGSFPTDQRFSIQVNCFRASPDVKEATSRRTYRWQQALGKGNFGEVSLYSLISKHGGDEDTNMPNDIAVKQVAADVHREEGEEVSAMRRVEGSMWVVRYLDCVRFNEGMHIMMPYYQNGTLHDLLHDYPGGKLPREMAVHYIAELVTATHDLHQNGIVHRDIKPSNIFLSQEGHIVLGDLGLARVFSLPSSSSSKPIFNPSLFPSTPSTSSTDKYALTSASGSVPFSAPEVMQHKPYSFGVDYYAVAVIGHILLSGALPFHGSAQAIKENPEDDELRKLVLWKGLNEAERDWFEMMLNVNPEKRIQAFEEIREHEVFRDADWDAIESQSIPVPFFDNEDDDDEGSEASFRSTHEDTILD